MKDPKRIWTVIVFLVSMTAILVVIFTVENDHLKRLIVAVLIVIQSAAFFWYSLSYWPGGQWCCKKCCEWITNNM